MFDGLPLEIAAQVNIHSTRTYELLPFRILHLGLGVLACLFSVYANAVACCFLHASRAHFLGRGLEFDALAEEVELASADFVREAVSDVAALMAILEVRAAVRRESSREESRTVSMPVGEGGEGAASCVTPDLSLFKRAR